LKIKNQITKNLGTKTQPDSAFQLSVTTIEEQGISGELFQTSSSGAGDHPEAIGKIRVAAGRRNQISRSLWSQKHQ
jgi:hypothetical protein